MEINDRAKIVNEELDSCKKFGTIIDFENMKKRDDNNSLILVLVDGQTQSQWFLNSDLEVMS